MAPYFMSQKLPGKYKDLYKVFQKNLKVVLSC